MSAQSLNHISPSLSVNIPWEARGGPAAAAGAAVNLISQARLQSNFRCLPAAAAAGAAAAGAGAAGAGAAGAGAAGEAAAIAHKPKSSHCYSSTYKRSGRQGRGDEEWLGQTLSTLSACSS